MRDYTRILGVLLVTTALITACAPAPSGTGSTRGGGGSGETPIDSGGGTGGRMGEQNLPGMQAIGLSMMRLAFQSDREGFPAVFLIDTGNGSTLRVTGDWYNAQSPALAPDGASLVFVSDRDGSADLFWIATLGENNLAENRTPDTPSNERDPAISPDGIQVAFVSDRDGADELYVMRIDGADVRRVTQSGGVSNPAWAPDGLRLVYEFTPPEGRPDLWVINVDGSGAAPLVSDPGSDRQPGWSPDGTRIAFASDRNGRSDIYVINSDGTGLQAISTDPADDSHPAWSTDGLLLAFQSDRAEDGSELYLLPVNGGETMFQAVRLTDNSVDDSAPNWGR